MPTSPSEQNAVDEEIRRSVKILAECFGRRLGEDTMAMWVKVLRPYAGPKLWGSFRELVELDHMPTLGEVKAHAVRLAKAAAQAPAPRELTLEERERSDRAAVLSMLWLHYEKGWSIEEIANETIGRAFRRQTGESAIAVVARAKEKYTREYVAWWMDQQQAKILAAEVGQTLDPARRAASSTPTPGVDAKTSKTGSWADLLEGNDNEPPRNAT